MLLSISGGKAGEREVFVEEEEEDAGTTRPRPRRGRTRLFSADKSAEEYLGPAETGPPAPASARIDCGKEGRPVEIPRSRLERLTPLNGDRSQMLSGGEMGGAGPPRKEPRTGIERGGREGLYGLRAGFGGTLTPDGTFLSGDEKKTGAEAKLTRREVLAAADALEETEGDDAETGAETGMAAAGAMGRTLASRDAMRRYAAASSLSKVSMYRSFDREHAAIASKADDRRGSDIAAIGLAMAIVLESGR